MQCAVLVSWRAVTMPAATPAAGMFLYVAALVLRILVRVKQEWNFVDLSAGRKRLCHAVAPLSRAVKLSNPFCADSQCCPARLSSSCSYDDGVSHRDFLRDSSIKINVCLLRLD